MARFRSNDAPLILEPRSSLEFLSGYDVQDVGRELRAGASFIRVCQLGAG